MRVQIKTETIKGVEEEEIEEVAEDKGDKIEDREINTEDKEEEEGKEEVKEEDKIDKKDKEGIIIKEDKIFKRYIRGETEMREDKITKSNK